MSDGTGVANRAKRSPSCDAAHVLGCSRGEAERLLKGRRVTPGEVEALAVEHYPWRRHVHDTESYWVTVSQADRLLRIPPRRIKQLLDNARLPHVVHQSGVRLMRRRDIVEVARTGAVGRPPS